MTNRYVKKVFQTDLPKYLVVLESKLIRIDNWDVNKCVFFKKIFTWSDDIANGKKYIKLTMLLCLPLIYNWLNGSNKLSPIPASLFNNK
jgi:hypothetical protein